MSRFIDTLLRRPAQSEIGQKSFHPEPVNPEEIAVFDQAAEAVALPEVTENSKPIVSYGSAFTTAYAVDLMINNLKAGKTVSFPSIGVEFTAEDLKPEYR